MGEAAATEESWQLPGALGRDAHGTGRTTSRGLASASDERIEAYLLYG